ncbi:Detected protein of unknown function [Hibiscus syriacus]|uniref:Uncharacterized protein n=1 Tax=Hibiscus syriacus TaxID=106335 RepID=A0A6A3B7P9_HIBSY|nr:Detected protein of unknown function [Hibiscus syriacus]
MGSGDSEGCLGRRETKGRSTRRTMYGSLITMGCQGQGLCSFRGGGFFGSEDGGDSMSFSAVRSSSISAARSSSVNGGLCVDPERKSGFDSDRRDSTFVESDVVAADIKAMRKPGGGVLDLDAAGFRDIDTAAFGSVGSAVDVGSNSIQNGLVGDNGVFCGGGSCRVTVNERGIKRSRKSFKGWRWIFRNNQEEKWGAYGR